jgi:hypothetical protein
MPFGKGTGRSRGKPWPGEGQKSLASLVGGLHWLIVVGGDDDP